MNDGKVFLPVAESPFSVFFFAFFLVFEGSGNHLGTQSSAKSWARPIENLKFKIIVATPVWWSYRGPGGASGATGVDLKK